MFRAQGPVQILNLFAIGRSANDRLTFGGESRVRAGTLWRNK